MAADPSGGGYWLVASDGGVFTFGDAPYLGSPSTGSVNAPVVGLAPDLPSGGYWLVAADGSVFGDGSSLLGTGS
jgi:hypothetical protein